MDPLTSSDERFDSFRIRPGPELLVEILHASRLDLASLLLFCRSPLSLSEPALRLLPFESPQPMALPEVKDRRNELVELLLEPLSFPVAP